MPTTRSVLRVGVTEIRRRLGSKRQIQLATPLPDLAITSARVPDGAEIAVDGVLESIENGVTFSGVVLVPWVGECRRCLEEVHGTVQVEVSEVFEVSPTEGETYPIEGDDVDLEPLVRDAVLLHLPLAPLCRPDCPGPAPESFPTSVAEDDALRAESDAEPPKDPRWAALDQLDLGD
jgi:uncharacterized protein